MRGWAGLVSMLLLLAPACRRHGGAVDSPPLVGPLVATPASPPQVGAGGGFSCLLGRDGRVRCWGDNALGQLGAPGGGSSAGCYGEAYEDEIEFPGRCDPEPRVVAGLDQVRQLAVGGSHACALRPDDSVWCWGGNWQGELGVGNDPRVTPSCQHDVACARTPLPVLGVRARS